MVSNFTYKSKRHQFWFSVSSLILIIDSNPSWIKAEFHLLTLLSLEDLATFLDLWFPFLGTKWDRHSWLFVKELILVSRKFWTNSKWSCRVSIKVESNCPPIHHSKFHTFFMSRSISTLPTCPRTQHWELSSTKDPQLATSSTGPEWACHNTTMWKTWRLPSVWPLGFAQTSPTGWGITARLSSWSFLFQHSFCIPGEETRWEWPEQKVHLEKCPGRRPHHPEREGGQRGVVPPHVFEQQEAEILRLASSSSRLVVVALSVSCSRNKRERELQFVLWLGCDDDEMWLLCIGAAHGRRRGEWSVVHERRGRCCLLSLVDFCLGCWTLLVVMITVTFAFIWCK